MTVVNVPLNTRGTLDTTNPISDRAPGTLVTARDVAHRWWGPRLGGKIVSHPHSLTTNEPTPALDLIKFTSASNTQIRFNGIEDQHLNLPNKVTIDMVVQVASMSHTTADPLDVNLMLMYPAFGIRLVSDNDATNKRKVRMIVDGSGGSDLSTTTGTTQLNVNSTYDARYQHHIRVVRNGTSWKLYVDGTLEGSATVADVPADDYSVWLFGGSLAGASPAGEFAAAQEFEGWINFVHVYKGAATDGGSPGEIPFTRNEATLLHMVFTRGPANESNVRDLSRYRLDGAIANAGTYQGEKVSSPFKYPVQGMTSFEDADGKSWNVVMTGGTLFWERA